MKNFLCVALQRRLTRHFANRSVGKAGAGRNSQGAAVARYFIRVSARGVSLHLSFRPVELLA
jgi:hypothetical protein